MRTTITNWNDLCDYILKHRKDELLFRVKSIYGQRDKKGDNTKISKIESITIEVEE